MNLLTVSCFDLNNVFTEQNILSKYEIYLSDYSKKKLGKIKSELHQKESRFGKLLLFHHLKKFHQLNPEKVEIGYTDLKRPFLVNSSIDFNISHSGGYIVLATVTKGKVGVDIEKNKTVNPTLYTAFFSSDECMKMKENPALFFEKWTLLESVTKADGGGLDGNLTKNMNLSQPFIFFNKKTFYKNCVPKLFSDCHQNITTTIKVNSTILYRI